MVQHISLFQIKPDVTAEQLENLMVETRIRLLKIPEVSNLRVGKRINTKSNPYQFFFAFETENTDRLRIIHESAIYHQFQQKVLAVHASQHVEYDYEMEPGKDIRYS